MEPLGCNDNSSIDKRVVIKTENKVFGHSTMNVLHFPISRKYNNLGAK